MFDYLILPVVRCSAGWLASAARCTLWLGALLALAELVLLPLRMPLAGIGCGLASSALHGVTLALVVVLAAWSHSVLLAGQGLGLTRWLVRIGAALAPLVPICWGYTFFTGRLLLYRQGELPLLLGVLLVVTTLVNIPRMAAAPWRLQLQVVVLPALLLLISCCDVPGLLVICAVLKLLAAWVGSSPLRLLASFAPRIISMPEKS